MLNIRANLGSQRFNLSSLSKDMGLGGERRDEEAAPQKGANGSANGSHAKQILGDLNGAHQTQPVESAQPNANIDALEQARRRAAEQRVAAESLLLEARALEEQLLSESTAAHEARKRADEMAALTSRAIMAEQEARERARIASEQHARVTTERQRIETVLTAGRLASEAATAEIAELKRRLEDVLRVASDASALLHAHEQRAAEVAMTALKSEKELADAAAQLAERQSAREAAEREAKAAEARAGTYGTGMRASASSSGVGQVPQRPTLVAEPSKADQVA